MILPMEEKVEHEKTTEPMLIRRILAGERELFHDLSGPTSAGLSFCRIRSFAIARMPRRRCNRLCSTSFLVCRNWTT